MARVQVMKRKATKRDIRHLTAGQTCANSIGELYEGMEVFGLTDGQFSFINIIAHLLTLAGPANVDISTWVAANFDLSHLENFLINGRIKQLRFLVDRSFPNRQPQFFEQLLTAFPDGGRGFILNLQSLQMMIGI